MEAAKLESVRVEETENNFFEYRGERFSIFGADLEFDLRFEVSQVPKAGPGAPSKRGSFDSLRSLRMTDKEESSTPYSPGREEDKHGTADCSEQTDSRDSSC